MLLVNENKIDESKRNDNGGMMFLINLKQEREKEKRIKKKQ